MLSCDRAREVYNALPPLEKRLAQALAVKHEIVPERTIASEAGKSGFRGKNGTKLTATKLKPIIEAAAETGWLIAYAHSSYGEDEIVAYRCHDAVAHAAALERGATWPMSVTARGRSWNSDPAELMREIFYTRGADALREHNNNRNRYDPYFRWTDVFGHRCPLDLLESLPPEIATKLFAQSANHHFYELSAMDLETSAYAARLGEENADALAMAAASAILSGRLDVARSIASNGDECLQLTTQAAMQLASGEFAAARELSAAAIESQRSKFPRRKALLAGPLAPLLTALLVTEPGGHWHGWAADQIRACKRREDIGDGLEYKEIEALVAETQTGNWDAMAGRTLDSRGTTWLALLLRGLRVRWGKSDTANALESMWMDCGLRAQMCGLTWLSAQFASLTEEAARDQGSLLSMRADVPAWKLKLDALTGAVSGRTAEGLTPQRASRLVWFVSEYQGHFRPEARLQKARQGGWTKGSKIGLRKLQTMSRDDLVATAADRRLIAHLRTVRDPFRGHNTIVFGASALLGLIDHPLLFDADDPQLRLEAVRAEPELRVTRAEGHIALSLFPPNLSPEGPVARRDGHRILVYDASIEQRAILSIVGDAPIEIPDEGEADLRAMLAGVTKTINVSSELALDHGDIEGMPADSQLHVHMWRVGSGGLRLRLRVFPLGSDGPSFAPGEGGAHVLGIRAGKTVQAQRDLAQELLSEGDLLARCPSLASAACDGADFRLRDPLECLELLAQLWELRESISVEWPEGDAISVVAARETSDLRLRITDDGQWLSVRGDLPVDEGRVLDMRALLDAVSKTKGRFIELEDGAFVALSEQLRGQLEQLHQLEGARAGRGKSAKLHLLAAGALGSLLDDVGEHKVDKAFDKRLARVREAASLRPRVPRLLEAELRDYQREGFAWLARLAHWGAGACLADDMGLGKTVQVLALLLHRAADGPALVLAPTSVVPNWEREAQRFAPTLRVRRFGTAGRQQLLDDSGPGDVLLCSYGHLQREAEMLGALSFATLVLDEAQAIKNASTKRAKAARGLQADFRVITTGTPVENHLGELWSLFAVLNPGLLGSARAFDRRFAKPIQQEHDADAARRLKRLVRPFMLRRTKAAVLDELPERTEMLVRVEPGESERAFYEALRREAVEQLQRNAEVGGGSGQQLMMLAALTKLRRAACNPVLVSADCDVGSAKLERAVSMVEDLLRGNHRALIFSQFVDHLKLVRAELERRGISFQYLDGSTPSKAREKAVDAFQKGEGDAFLISLKAGGFGLNLTAADYVIHLDPWWNPAAEDQASDRVHRIGQQRPVTIYRLVTRGTIEERIVDMHHRKRDLADSLLEGNERAFKLEPEALLSILSEATGQSASAVSEA